MTKRAQIEAEARSKAADRVHADPARHTDAVLRRLALAAVGYSGADIEHLVRDVRRTARREQRPITFDDLMTALRQGRPDRSPELKRTIAVHEAGHAVVRHVLQEGRVMLLSIDQGFGGVTVAQNIDGVGSEAKFANWLAIDLAGRAAEEIVLGSPSAGSGGGADSDLAHATSMALAMETTFGFGEHQPLLHVDHGDGSQTLEWRPDLARRVNARLEGAYAHARTLIEAHRSLLDRLADALQSAGTLEEAGIARILEGADR